MSISQFVWHDLMTTDAKASLDFYGHVVGWTSVAMPMEGGGTYHRLEAGRRGMGGVMQLSAEQRDAGMKTGWVGYVRSNDVDADASRVQKAGGKVHRPPSDIPQIGRFAPVSDPQGAGFILFKPQPPPGGAPPRAEGRGTVGWAELRTHDWEAAFGFYSGLLGWTKAEAMDMGPMGTYQLFSAGAAPVGGMMNWPDQSAAPGWLYYFVVDGIDAAEERVKAKGGELLHGPSEVPGGAWMLQARDPQGGLFALTAPAR